MFPGYRDPKSFAMVGCYVGWPPRLTQGAYIIFSHNGQDAVHLSFRGGNKTPFAL